MKIVASNSPAFWKFKALCARGRAREVGAHYDRHGRKLVAFAPYGALIARNPESGETLEGSVTIGQEYFSAALREYTNWRQKWWREALQNSVDAGATTITCTVTNRPDGTVEVVVDDDGAGMDRDTLITKFLVLGGTTKKEGSSSTGGFGEAKKLLILPWISWEIATRETRAFGQNIRYKYQALERPRRGTLLRVVMPKDNATSEADALAFIKRCTLPGIRFTVNGTAVRADHRPGKEVHAPELDAAGGKVKVYHNASAEGPGIWVRKGGLFMFEKWASSELKGVVTAEIQVPSTQILTANRDGFSDWKTQRALDDFTNKLATDVLSTLKRKKGILRKKYLGTGKFRSGEKRAAVLESIRKLAGGDQGEKRTATELVEIVTTGRPTGGPTGGGGGGPGGGEIGPPAPGDLFGLPTGTAPGGAPGGSSEPGGPIEPAALLAMLEGLTLKGASADRLEAIAKQVSWEPDFFLVNEIEGFYVPAKFKPETMAPTVKKVARFWADLCRFILMQMGSIEEYGIGFVFDTDKLGVYMQETSADGHEEKWILLNPYRDAKIPGVGGVDEGEVYSLAKKEHIAELYAIAVHECTHLANRLPQHNEAFASAFTKNVALTSGKERAINAIRKTITARGETGSQRQARKLAEYREQRAIEERATGNPRKRARELDEDLAVLRRSPAEPETVYTRAVRAMARGVKIPPMSPEHAAAIRAGTMTTQQSMAARLAATGNPLMHLVGVGAHLLPFVNPPPACAFCDRPTGLAPTPGWPGRHQCADAPACARRARALLAKEARTANAAGLPWTLKRTSDITANAKLVWAPIALVMAAADRSQRLDLDDPTGGQQAIEGRLAGALAHFRAGRPMTPPTIMVYPERERSGIVFQDGRHRLVAAWQLGARWAPFWLAGGAKRLERILRGGRAGKNPESIPDSLRIARQQHEAHRRRVAAALAKLPEGYEIKGRGGPWRHQMVGGEHFWIGKKTGNTGELLLEALGYKALIPHIGREALGLKSEAQIAAEQAEGNPPGEQGDLFAPRPAKLKKPPTPPPAPKAPEPWTFDGEVTAAAANAHSAAKRGALTGEAFLFYRPGRGTKPGALVVATEAPDGYSLSDSYQAPYRSKTLEQLRAWIYDRARRLPILPNEGPVKRNPGAAGRQASLERSRRPR